MPSAPVIWYLRRDLRLTDNTALNAALLTGAQVAPVFIVDPRQVGEGNAYRSPHGIRFMRECLEGVDNSLKGQGSGLAIINGAPEEALPRYTKEIGATAVYANRDYTPFSDRRDSAIEKALSEAGVTLHMFDDALLNPPGSVQNGNNEPYKVFTPFYKAASRVPVAFPATNTGSYFPLSNTELQNGFATLREVEKSADSPAAIGGRIAAEERLSLLSNLRNYETERDLPAREGTSLLSPYLKFGVVSAREAYHAMREALPKNHHALTRQLYWRDFFTHIAAALPQVFGASFKSEYDAVPWDYDEEKFARWKDGTTGFPIVDAGMRQLRDTGWMHNRVRMIVASFLTKDLHLDWRDGEKHFATLLIDYDPAVNNGSWQWVAGTGADAQPWFRIFNPWLQQKKFDGDAEYIKRYVKELRDVPPEAIHSWSKSHAEHAGTGYPAPMVDHALEAAETKRRFSTALAGQRALL